MEQDQINNLIAKYVQGTATDAELEELRNWYRNTAYQDALYPDEEQAVHRRMLARLEKEITPVPVKRRLLSHITVAASILLCLGIAFYFYGRRHEMPAEDKNRLSQDINPGGNKAVLTLANGDKVDLSDAQTGIVINTRDLMYNDGTKINLQSSSLQHTVANMMVSTPEGGTYQVILPDSTRVWLNAASALKFPSTFAEVQQRRVELSGEAYFEVARIKKGSGHLPFVVVSNNQEVEVLGTHFNVNAYPGDADTKTSLLEGLIRIKNGKGNSLLKPGQQAISNRRGIELVDGDAEDAIAWKNGYFMFDNEDLASIMVKVCRWYKVTASYEDEAVKNVKYYGTISRFEKISKVLSKLEVTGNLKFEVKGSTVKISHK
ncbi:transmembrane sensor [Pedobacter africanus]|uniref:Ferric-dicitrate binding protein FerR (Iron transport regulator) n=1 Tax=Pedobacter africanus TaxID=151894 RepID=A0ACC6KRI1_9SPHI|nr:FecR domain-containing protein [Pedobacter africanus]MDR6781711.1 ferric-dicitrate binding protein FerR (iron transport regulator) [Pedobacter africanus]